jgi:hypothetical protein
MEGLYQFYKERTIMYAVHEFDERSDNVTVSEVTVSDNHQTNEVQTKNLSNADLEAWLITHSKAPTAGIRYPIFRIVWFNLDKDPIPDSLV